MLKTRYRTLQTDYCETVFEQALTYTLPNAGAGTGHECHTLSQLRYLDFAVAGSYKSSMIFHDWFATPMALLLLPGRRST